MQDRELIPLSRLPVGTPAYVRKLEFVGSTRRRMLDLGIMMGTPVEALQKSPSGDPTAYKSAELVIPSEKRKPAEYW